jgi:hypothetical protein
MRPTPPIEMQSPQLAYQIFYLIFAFQLVAALAWLAVHSWRTHSRLPLVAFAGSLFVGYFVPPVFNHLLMTWFPSNIPWAYINAFDMRDPLFDFVGYTLYFGLGGYVMMRAFQRGLGSRAVALTAVIFGVADLLYELPFLAAGMYTYYGQQPLAILTYPLHWLVMNATVPVITGFIMYWADRLARSNRERAAAIFAAPSVAAASLFVPMAPIATTLRADLPNTARLGTSLLAMAVCVVAISYIARWADRIEPAKVTDTVARQRNPQHSI